MTIDGSSGGVPALRKAAKILDFVVASTTAPTAAEITRSLGLAKSSAHGLLSVMEELGIVRINIRPVIGVNSVIVPAQN